MNKKLIRGSEIPHLVDPQFAHYEFDTEEVAEMEALAKNPPKPLSPQEQSALLANLKSPAKTTKTAITIRLSDDVIQKFKQMSKEEGIPYQTLMSSVLYKVANKKLSLEIV